MKTKQFTSKITHGSEEITMKISAKYHETMTAGKRVLPHTKIYKVIRI